MTVNDRAVVLSLARACEGAALALKNYGVSAREAQSNLVYAKANIEFAQQLLRGEE